jgi:uncharacterized integral membrane protein (TIGR00697 family)
MRLTWLKDSFDREATLIGMYAAIFVIAPVLSVRIVDVFGAKLLVGSILMSFAFGFLDVINNDFGAIRARQVVVGAFIVRLVVWALILLSTLLPTFHESKGYAEVVLRGVRILIAGEISLTFSQLLIDIPVFDRLKKYSTRFSVRYNLSNAISHFFGLIIFILIAFVGTGLPMFKLFWSKVIVGIVISIILTPLFGALCKS